MSITRWVCAPAMVLLLGVGCGDDNDGGGGSNAPTIVDELTEAGIGQYLDLAPASMRQNGAWQEYTYDTDDETAICLRGTAYQANLRRGSTNKVLLYLEGGGACWSTETCWGAAPLAKLTAGSASNLGVLDASNPANPFRDWNVVYAPYCDGSVFAGDNVVDYDGNRTFHHGQQNIGAAVGLMQREFPNPEQIVVAGSSAGGYGTYTGYATVRVAYPDAEVLVFNDSGPGLQDPADREVNAAREDRWLFRQFIPESCAECDAQLTYLSEWSLERDPTLRVAYFNYLQDNVLRFFLSLGAEGFEGLLKEVTGDVQGRWPSRFKRFFKQGDAHTVLELPSFFTEEIAGLSVVDWTADFLTNGPDWQDTVEPAP